MDLTKMNPEAMMRMIETMMGEKMNMERFMKNNESAGIVECQGHLFMPGFTDESIKYMKDEWMIPENSVFVSSYPKTGTAWMMEIVRQLLYGEDEAMLQISKGVPMPLMLLEMGPSKKFDIHTKLPFSRKRFATHLSTEIFDFEKLKKSNSKMIYVYRNPKDQAVSWYHFANKFPLSDERKNEFFGKDWNDFFARYVNGEHPTGLPKGQWYPDHLLGWLKYSGDENFLMVEYESLKKNFKTEVERIAKFLGVDLSEDHAKKVADRCTVSSMKAQAGSEKTGFWKMNVRKGEVGGWKEQLTVSQSELIDKIMEEKMASSGIEFTYVI